MTLGRIRQHPSARSHGSAGSPHGRTRRTGWCIPIAIAVFAVSGCVAESDSEVPSATHQDAGGAFDAGGSPFHQFLGGYSNTVCDQSVGPCCKHGYKPGTCASLSTSLLAGFYGEPAKFDPAKGQECLAAFAAQYHPPCGDKTGSCASVTELAGVPRPLRGIPACVEVFHGGTGAPGTPCSSPLDCAPTLYGEVDCSVVKAGVQGVCREHIVAHLGDACDSWDTKTPEQVTTHVCASDEQLYCDSDTRKCAAIQPDGSTCTSSSGCQCEHFCASGTCVTPAVGDPCVPGDAGGTGCAHGFYCDPGTSKCAEQKPEGAACIDSNECSSLLCSKGACSNLIADAFLCGVT